MSVQDVTQFFSTLALSDGESEYLNSQARRISYLQEVVSRFRAEIDGQCDLLDVGPHFLTRYLMEKMAPPSRISTLGYEYPKLIPRNRVYLHATIDFNECASITAPFPTASFDIITICEVVEHLFIPPYVMLSFLKQFLKSASSVIILGTPNAVSISKRMRMMFGENPFHELTPNYKSGTVHIREYTMQELRHCGEKAGVRVVFEEYNNYWEHGAFPGSGMLDVLPKDVENYREGITIAYRTV